MINLENQIEWGSVSLDKCCKIVSGSTPSRNHTDYWEPKDHPWVTPKDLSKLNQPVLDDTPEYISESGLKSCSTRLLPKGTILFSSRAPIGHVAIAGREMCTNQGFKSLIPRKGMDSRYLYYCMKHLAPRIADMGNGATFKEVSKSVMETIEIPIPFPSDMKKSEIEQRRIASILDKADEIRRKRQQAIALTDQLLRSTFLEMFGDPVTNPKGWEEKELGEIADIRSGVTKGRRFAGKETTLVPYMRVANVQDGHLNLSEIKKVEVLPEDVEKYKLRVGDILLTEGGDPDKLGRGAVWQGEIESCIHQNHIFRVRPNSEYLCPEYLCAIIGSSRGKRYFAQAAKQTTGIASINMRQLQSFPVLVPPFKVQLEYLEAVKAVGQLCNKQYLRTKHENDLFSSLQQSAFKGEL